MFFWGHMGEMESDCSEGIVSGQKWNDFFFNRYENVSDEKN